MLHEQGALQFPVVSQRKQREQDGTVADTVFDGKVIAYGLSCHRVLYPCDVGLVGSGYLLPVLAREGVFELVGVAADLALVDYHKGLLDREDVVLVLHFVHVVGDGNPDVVGGRCRQCLLEGILPV